jgi:hypothetical protein
VYNLWRIVNDFRHAGTPSTEDHILKKKICGSLELEWLGKEGFLDLEKICLCEIYLLYACVMLACRLYFSCF